MSLHVCPGEIFILDSRLANFGKETVLLAFCLQCFHCGAVALSASFFPFGVLEEGVRYLYRFLTIVLLSIESDFFIERCKTFTTRKQQFCNMVTFITSLNDKPDAPNKLRNQN